MRNQTSNFDSSVLAMADTHNMTSSVQRLSAEGAGALLLVVMVTCDVYAFTITRSRRTRRFWAFEGGSYLRTYIQKLGIINFINGLLSSAVYFVLILWPVLTTADSPSSDDSFHALALRRKCINIGSDTLLVTLTFAAIAASAGTRFISFLYSTTDAPTFGLFDAKSSGSGASAKGKRKPYGSSHGAGKQSTSSASHSLVAKQPTVKAGSDAQKWGLKFDSPTIQAAVMPYFAVMALLSLFLFLLHLDYFPQPLSNFVFNRAVCYDAGSRFTLPLTYTDLLGICVLVVVQCIVCPLVELYHGRLCSASQQDSSDSVESGIVQQQQQQLALKAKSKSFNPLSLEDSAFEYGEAARTPFVQTTLTFTWGIFLAMQLYVFFYRQYDVVGCVLLQLFWLAIDSIFILILCLLFAMCNGITTRS